MNDIEQTMLALMLDTADNLNGKKFSGTISELRDMALADYEIDRVPDAFENAIEFLLSTGLGRRHHHPPLEDYISINRGDSSLQVLWSVTADEPESSGAFSFGSDPPKYPILASFKELGSDWLHDLAAALGDADSSADQAIASETWTGRYIVSDADRAKVSDLLIRMRTEIENLPLSNTERSNALAAVDAAESLTSAADPAWALIIRILQSPILANITALAALIISIIKA